ncbi:hypothetical protein CCR75_002519 [Bremia lactucae]|uniref:Uncharacterized protein n=1 Tax=Bremia lactucae TaxID=4779 RepID=A0A976IJ40_BRELC|nr:hypothetical protein CCR75_002519 [Bremia lactucae]
MVAKVRIVSDHAKGTSEKVPGNRGRRIETQINQAVGDLVLCVSKLLVGSTACQQEDWTPDHRIECKQLVQLKHLGLRSDQVADVLLLGRVLRRPNRAGLHASELVWYQEDMDDQELLLLAVLAQKIKLVDGKESFH